ncbi:hypothetical protein [Paroceanicella profunda]|nr:hypothetical protein [Paroceanicella profunda]
MEKSRIGIVGTLAHPQTGAPQIMPQIRAGVMQIRRSRHATMK